MKFIVEEASEIKAEMIEELNESTGSKQKNYYIHGVFSTPEVKNRNGRIYPMKIWENEIANYQKHIEENSINTLGELEHPSRTKVSPLDAVIKITELKIEDGLVKGRAKILNNNSEKTNQLKALIDEGMKIGVSSRGVGNVKNGIVENFKLITYDVVAEPSDYNAQLEGINESLNESLGNPTFTIDENGRIVELSESTCGDECTLYEKEDIESAIKTKFNDILGSWEAKKVDENISTYTYNEISEVLNKLDFKTSVINEVLSKLKEYK